MNLGPVSAVVYLPRVQWSAGTICRQPRASLHARGLPDPTPIVNLPDRDDPRYDAELLALDVDLYIDCGTVDDDYVSALEAITGRTEIPGIILDGALTNVASVYRRLGAALGVPERGERLAAEAERIIDSYRGALADPPVRVVTRLWISNRRVDDAQFDACGDRLPDTCGLRLDGETRQ